MERLFIIIFCSICLQSFSQTVLSTDTKFYEMVFCDMVNVYDTLYKNDNRDTLYIEKSKKIKNILGKQVYDIKNRTIIVLNKKQINKLVKRKKNLEFQTFSPNITSDGLIRITFASVGSHYKKLRVWRGYSCCGFFRLVYKYDYKCQKWVYVDYEKCDKTHAGANLQFVPCI